MENPHPLYSLFGASIPNRMLALNHASVDDILSPSILATLGERVAVGLRTGTILKVGTRRDLAKANRPDSEVSALCAIVARLAYRSEGIEILGMTFRAIPGLFSKAVVRVTPAATPEPTVDEIVDAVLRPVDVLVGRAGLEPPTRLLDVSVPLPEEFAV